MYYNTEAFDWGQEDGEIQSVDYIFTDMFFLIISFYLYNIVMVTKCKKRLYYNYRKK